MGKELLGPVLFAYKDPIGIQFLPNALIQRIKNYEIAHNIEINVEQISIVLRQNGDSARFLDVDNLGEGNNVVNGESAMAEVLKNQNVTITLLHGVNDKLLEAERDLQLRSEHVHATLNGMVSTLTAISTFRATGHVNVHGKPATLTPLRTIKTLFNLWNEYIVGINGNKPAKSFNSTERGLVRYKYCRRKKFWSAVEKLMETGLTSHEAITRMEVVYARNNATMYQTLLRIGKDKNLTLYNQATFH